MLGVSADGGAYRFWRRGRTSAGCADDDDVLAPRRCPRHHDRAVCYAGAPVAADAILPFRPSGRNEPYALRNWRSPAWSHGRRRRPAEPRAGRGARGFTLVEILVALAVVAVALAAGMRAVAQAADGATLLKQRTLALWVAQNRLAAAQLAVAWPTLGSARGRGAAGRRALRVARDGHRDAQPGVPQDRDRRRRSRGTGLRARPPCGLSRAAARSHETHRAGFTLIELLIALAILGLFAALGYRGLAALTESEAQLAAEAAHWRALDTLFTRLEADCARRCRAPFEPVGARACMGRRCRPEARRTALLARRAGIRGRPGSGGQRIGYRLHNGAVEVLYWPFLDQPSAVVPEAYALIDGVAAFGVAYLDARGTGASAGP